MASSFGQADASPSTANSLTEGHAKPPAPRVDDVEDEEFRKPSASSTIDSSSSPKKSLQTDKSKTDTKGPVLDTQSETAFPALGAGTKAPVRATPTPQWGAKKPVLNGTSNGVPSSPISSGASTPLSGTFAPGTRGGQTSAPRGPMHMAMPGKSTDRITLNPSQMDTSKPIQPYLDRLNKRTRAKITRRTAADGKSIIFEGSGPKKDVSEALRTVARELSATQKTKIAIPVSCRSHIIGQGGITVKEISVRSGAKIQLPRSTPAIPGDNDDFATIDIEIEGDPIAVELARLDIDKIVSARASSVNMKLENVPPEFFPFLAGPHRTRIQTLEQTKKVKVDIPQFHTWQHRPPPRTTGNQPLDFQSHPELYIKISGDRTGAQEARTLIERRVQEFRRQLSVQDQPFQRGQHQFIVGDRGMSLDDFLAETECTVVLPPIHEDSEDVFIIGPPGRLQLGIDRATALAAEMQSERIDLGRYCRDAPHGAEAHSRALARYLEARKLDAEFSKLHDAQLAFPSYSDPSTTWDIYSRDKVKTIQARGELIKIVQAHPPSRMSVIPIHPFFHPHLRRQFVASLRKDHGVFLVLPRSGEGDHVTLVYEGAQDTSTPFQIPRQRPTDSEAQQHKAALRKAQEFLVGIIGQQPEVVDREVAAPLKYHDKLERFVQREQSQSGVQFPVELVLNNRKGRSKVDTTAADEAAMLRGLTADVAALSDKIVAFIADEEKDDLERAYTTSFDFPQKYNGYLIGREGSKINQLKEQFDVDIKTLDNGKIEVRGPKTKADACQDHINGLRKKFEDEATYVLKIEPKFHGQLVGKKGADVNRLQDKYNVKIQFPPSAHGHHDAPDDKSVSEHGGRRAVRSNQAPDEVVIRGPRQMSDKARAELLDLYQYTKDTSFTATLSVSREHLGSLIGQRGSEIDRLRSETGAQIDLPERNESADPKTQVEIKIRGTKKAVDLARAEVQKKIQHLNDTVTRKIEVDRALHGPLIGAHGSHIRQIVIDAGGPESSHQVVRFPERGSESSTIRVEGHKTLVDKVIAGIEAFVEASKSTISEIVHVPTDKHGQLIGPGGETRRNFEKQYSVQLEVPPRGSSRTDIKLAGSAENVAAAKAALEKIASQQREMQTVEVPSHLHHHVAENGRFFARLRGDLGVSVDHGGSKIPTRPATAPRHEAKEVLPLITDEEGPDSHSWKLQSPPSIDAADGSTIPWNLKGDTANKVAAAQKLLQEAVHKASTPSATGYLRLSDPSTYRFVVGRAGRTIENIRDQSGCDIKVPNGRNQKPGDPDTIRIVGTAEGCERARELILEVVRGAGQQE